SLQWWFFPLPGWACIQRILSGDDSPHWVISETTLVRVPGKQTSLVDGGTISMDNGLSSLNNCLSFVSSAT
ncbi:hypothetical protein B0H14DRAFT_2923321, partial [Mycena olivaceomarginata]